LRAQRHGRCARLGLRKQGVGGYVTGLEGLGLNVVGLTILPDGANVIHLIRLLTRDGLDHHPLAIPILVEMDDLQL
jgi:hypothetical protein